MKRSIISLGLAIPAACAPLLAACASLLASCAPPSVTEIDVADRFDAAAEAATPWTGLAANDDDDEFHFVIVTDRTGGARLGVFESAMPKVNLLEPAFVVSVGDLIEGYTDDQAQLDRQWDQMEGFIGQLETPFFYVAGNHDMSNAVMAEAWRDRFGPSFYKFVYKNVLFLVLNSELFGMVGDPETPLPGPWTQAEQLAFVERVLTDHPDPRWTIVLIHQPLWDYQAGVRGDWPKIEAMLGKRDYTVFAGHFHRYVKNIRNDRKYFTLATTGGGSRLRGPVFGEFDHVAWVTMTENGPRIANLMLEGIYDENIVTADSRAVVQALSSAIQSVAAYGAGDLFETGSVAFEVTNPGTDALTVTPHVDAGPDLRYLGGAEQITLAPGASERITIELAASAPIAYHAITPGRITWSLATPAGDAALVLESSSALLPVARFQLSTGGAPSVDGDLSDWDALPYVVDRQGDVALPSVSPNDISYRFGVREADGDVYFAFQVTDDSIAVSANEGPRFQDHVLISVDARPDPERSRNDPLNAAIAAGYMPRIAMDYMTLADAAEDRAIAFLADARAAVDWKTRRTDTGYNAEAKVSGAFLDAQHGSPWEALRIGVAATDWDEGESSGVALNWQPSRYGDAPVAGSGTFVRSN